MRFWKKLSSKTKVRPSDLIVVFLLLVVFSAWPPSVGKFAVNKQGLAPHLPVGGVGEELNWLEVVPLQSLGVQSKAALIVAYDNGRVIAAKHPGERLPIASLTKLITARLVRMSSLAPQQILTVSPLSIDNQAAPYVSDNNAISCLCLTQADGFTVNDLLMAALVASANDAALALAKAIAADNDMFIATAQNKLIELGLVDTKIFEPTGLNSANVSTAGEIAQLARWAWDDNRLVKFSNLPKVTIEGTSGKFYNLQNTNELVGSSGKTNILASKTGYLDEAGYNLVQLIRNQGGSKYLIVLLGAPSKQTRIADARLLSDWLNLFQ